MLLFFLNHLHVVHTLASVGFCFFNAVFVLLLLFLFSLSFNLSCRFHFIRRLDFASSVQVNFEKPDSGFFFKHSAVQSNNNNNPIVDIKNNPIAAKENQDSILSFNRFTVAQANHPVSIRASYGPFSTKQTVPARFTVPEDAADNYGYHTQVSDQIMTK